MTIPSRFSVTILKCFPWWFQNILRDNSI